MTSAGNFHFVHIVSIYKGNKFSSICKQAVDNILFNILIVGSNHKENEEIKTIKRQINQQAPHLNKTERIQK